MRSIAVLAATLLLSSPAMAAQGEVCASEPQPMPAPFNNDVVFKCKTAGDLTIPQLYAKGWRVVSVIPTAGSMEEMQAGRARWVVVVEKL